MRSSYILILLLGIAQVSFSQEKRKLSSENQTEVFEKKINELYSEINRLKGEQLRLETKSNDNQEKLESRQNTNYTNLSVLIGATSNIIQSAGIIAGAFGIFLTVFVSWQLNKTEKIAKEIKVFKKYIEDNVDGFYKQLQIKEALQLLKILKESPQEYRVIYPRLLILTIPKKYFQAFRTLFEIAKNLKDDLLFQSGDFKNQTYPLLLTHFPEQVYRDSEIMESINTTSPFYYLSNQKCKSCIKALCQVVKNSSVDEHKQSIKRMLIDSVSYNQDLELLTILKKELGVKKISEIQAVWIESDLSDVDAGHKSILKKNGLF